MSVDQLTVQQLKIFLAVYKHKSASLAAAELGVTNSTVSRALAAARSVFDDVLFVRTANGFVPTNKAHELASPTSDMVPSCGKLTRVTRAFYRRLAREVSKFALTTNSITPYSESFKPAFSRWLRACIFM